MPSRALESSLFTLAIALPLALCEGGCASIPQGRAAVDAVNVQGGTDVDASDVEDKIATTESSRFLGLWEGVMFDYEIFDPYVFQRDLSRVERFYRARGFYEAHAKAGRVEYVKPNHVRVTVVVDEGAAVRINRVDVQGTTALPNEVAAAAFGIASSHMKAGARFDEDNFAAAERALRKSLTDRGYAYATVSRAAIVDLPHHTAAVTFTVVPGRVAKLGPITIEGLGALPSDPVLRALELHEGEEYSTRRLEDAQQSVLDLGVFGAVDVDPDLTQPDREAVPIKVHVEPSLLHTVRLGGGIELDVIKTDVHLRAGWENHNFLGGLRDFSVDFRPGLELYPTRLPDLPLPQRVLPEERLHAELSQPGFIEARTHGILRSDFNIFPVLLTPDYTASDPVLGYREIHGAAGVERTIWKLYTALTYNAQDDIPFTYVGPLNAGVRSIFISYIDILNRLDFRDDRIHPHKGFYLGNDLQFAGGIFGGDATDIREQPEARAYIPIGKRLTLAMRGSVGLLFPFNYGQTLQTDTAAGNVPAGVDTATWARDVQVVYFRSFFAGGPSSDRGWPFMGIGPHGIAPFFDPNLAAQSIATQCNVANPDPVRCAVPLGGLSLWEASLELRYALTKELEAATFCDTADVSQHELDIRLQRPHLSCGLGFAYDTPVGPIRLDLAYRIPGLQSLEKTQPGDDANPGTILGVPLAVAFGIGEAF